MNIFTIVTIVNARLFRIPSLTRDVWTGYNQEVNSLLGPLHFDIVSENINPATAASEFVIILSKFLSGKDEFLNKEKKSNS